MDKRQPVRPVARRQAAPSGPASMLSNAGAAVALLCSFALLFVITNWQWLLFIALPPSEFPEHWVRRSTGLDPVRNCFDLAHEQDDIYERKGALDAVKQSIKFCEDVEMLHGKGLDGWALLSCDAGRDKWNTVMGPLLAPKPRGAFWVYNYGDAAQVYDGNASAAAPPTLLPLRGFPDELDFHPLGSDVLPASTDDLGRSRPARLFVVNHGSIRSTVEVFDLYTGAEAKDWYAQYVRTLSHPLATHTPNAITALSSSDFLVTQDHLFALRPAPIEQLQRTYALLYGAKVGSILANLASNPILSALLPKLETLLGLRFSFAVHVRFDERVVANDKAVNAAIVARKIAFANGIAKSPNGKIVAIASTLMPGVLLYSLEQSSSEVKLTLLDSVYTPNLADNIAFSRPMTQTGGTEDEGNDFFGSGSQLIVGGAPSGLKLMKFAKDPSNLQNASPSWIVAIRPVPKLQLAEHDDAAYPAHKRMLGTHKRFAVRTFYQGQKPVKLDPPYKGVYDRVGIASASGGALDPNVGGGTLLVSGLYSDPGVMVCFGVGH